MTTRTVPGTGYGNVYVDSLIWGGRVWSESLSYPGHTFISVKIGVGQEFMSRYNDYIAAHRGNAGLLDGTQQDFTPEEYGMWRMAEFVFSSVCNVQFYHPYDPADPMRDSPDPYVHDIVVWKVNTGSTSAGSSETPGSWDGQIWTYLNHTSTHWQHLTFGGAGFQTMLHELGHAIGLAHPHDGGYLSGASKFPGVEGSGDLGEHNLNQSVYTVMSYNHGWTGAGAPLAYGNMASLGAFDIAAVQALYGVNTSWAMDDDVYALPTQNAVGTSWMCIWDTGGIDTISGEQSTTGVRIDLREATLMDGDPHAGGYISQQSGIAGGFTIANGAVIENATGGSGDDLLHGNDAVNRLIGNDGDDTLNGQGGADLMVGGAGWDNYYVDDAGDLVLEEENGGKADLVLTRISYTLTSHVEQLAAYGTDSISLTGNTLDNIIEGNEASNKIDGGAGADRMIGGAGSDTYYVDSTSDQIVEEENDGLADLVVTTVSHSLAAYVEHLTASGSSPINLTGNTLSNIMTGNAGANMIGGGLGNDTLAGGAGVDQFVFDTMLNAKTNVDILGDYNMREDTIRLENAIFKKLKTGTLKKDFFKISSKAKDKNDYILYDKKTGYLSYDADGSGSKYKAVAFAKLAAGLKMAHSEFKVI